MANRQRGDVAIAAGDRTFTMRLTTGAMADLEDACSTPDRPMVFPEILERVGTGSIKYMRLFVWAALQHHHPGLKVTEAGQLIDELGGPTKFGDYVTKAAQSLQPDREDQGPQATQAIPSGTGETSTSKPGPSA